LDVEDRYDFYARSPLPRLLIGSSHAERSAAAIVEVPTKFHARNLISRQPRPRRTAIASWRGTGGRSCGCRCPCSVDRDDRLKASVPDDATRSTSFLLFDIDPLGPDASVGLTLADNKDSTVLFDVLTVPFAVLS
jgi:hypothetical protein